MPLEKLDPLFVDQLKELKHKLFDVPREKKLIHLQEEQTLNGEDLANYVQQLVSQIDEIPQIHTVWESVL